MELARVYAKLRPQGTCFKWENVEKYMELIEKDDLQLRRENSNLKQSCSTGSRTIMFLKDTNTDSSW